VIVAAGGKVSLSAANFSGNLLILSSAMLWASGTVISGPLLKQISPLRLAFFSSLITTPMHLAIVSPQLAQAMPKLAEWDNFAALFYSGVFSTGIAYVTWHVGVRRLGGSHASVYQNVVTLVAVLGGWIGLGEPMLGSQLVGGLLMIIGLLLIRRTRR
jgi:drug/metabolite transporter (DMT)-like permease